MSHYETLGVDPEASKEAIKSSYRLKALKYHPDRCSDANARQRFQEITEAYEVLRDDVTRAVYDATRAQVKGSPLEQPFTWGKDGNFEADFEKWWKARGFGQEVDEELLKERRHAQRRQRAAAWEAEKMEASANKARSERVRWRASNAQAERHARVLSQHWQTYAGLCWQDALVMSLFLAGTACAALLVRPPPKPHRPE